MSMQRTLKRLVKVSAENSRLEKRSAYLAGKKFKLRSEINGFAPKKYFYEDCILKSDWLGKTHHEGSAFKEPGENSVLIETTYLGTWIKVEIPFTEMVFES